MALQIPTPKTFLKRFQKPSIDEVVQKRVEEELKKYREGEPYKYNVSPLNSKDHPSHKTMRGGITYSQLREFAELYPVARACIEFRKTQLTQLDWMVSPKIVTVESWDSPKTKEVSKKINDFFRFPTGKKSVTFSTWLKEILEDALVIDAVAIYRRRNRRGDIIGYLPVDGSTIELILDKDGTTPEPPQKAYVQKIRGKETTRLDIDEMIYAMTNPRTHSPFGFSPIEALIVTISTALRLQSYNLSYLSEGNVPEGFVEIPRDIASSRDQLTEWQNAWDAMLSGDPRFQRRLKFLPEGMKYQPTRTAEDMTFERFERWLLQNTCAVFNVAPSDIGFTFDTNRSQGESNYEVGRERGLFPTALWFKEMMDNIIQSDFGEDEYEFRWTNINPTNKKEEAEVVTKLTSGGLMSIDEWRIGENLKPTGAVDPFISTPIGPIFVKDLAKQSEAGLMPILPYKPAAEVTGDGKKKENGKSKDGTGADALASPNVPPQASKGEDIIKELRRWKKVALNDLKGGKDIREFKTDVLDYRTQDVIKRGLAKVQTKDDIESLFSPFVSSEYTMRSSWLSLYEDIEKVLDSNGAVQTWPYPTATS